jgi:hypothetical protein
MKRATEMTEREKAIDDQLTMPSLSGILNVIWRRPEYRGNHTRRVVLVTLTVLVSRLVVQFATAPIPDWRRALGVLFIAAMYGAADLLLVRRLGITVSDDALTLHQLALSRRVPWSKIEGFEWQLWGRVELLVVKLDTGRVALATTIWTVKNYLSWLGSPKMRSRTGREVDPLATLESAWKSAVEAAP